MALVTFKHPLTEVRHLTSLNGDDLNGNPKEGVRFGCHDGGPRSLIMSKAPCVYAVKLFFFVPQSVPRRSSQYCADSRAS